MPRIKLGLISGIAAFVLSLVTGIMAGVNTLIVFLRAFIFMGIFFSGGIGVQILAEKFFSGGDFDEDNTGLQNQDELPGSRVNITVEDKNYAVPENQELGNIEDLILGSLKPTGIEEEENIGLDKNDEDVYNNKDGGEGLEFEELKFHDELPVETLPPKRAVFSPSFGDDVGLGGLADLESMSTAFSSDINSAQPEVGEAAYSSSSNKNQPLKGDFSPEELAKGIQTVLRKENK